jgi:hypothetical protein
VLRLQVELFGCLGRQKLHRANSRRDLIGIADGNVLGGSQGIRLMATTKQRLTAARKQIAIDTSATFYGILATLSAALPARADQLTVKETILGAIFIGLVGLANRWFMDVLKLETERGRHLAWNETFAVMRQGALAFLFPAISAVTIGLASVIGATLASGLQAVFYLGVLMAAISVFLSSFVLDLRILPALWRGSIWAALTILLLLVRGLVT